MKWGGVLTTFTSSTIIRRSNSRACDKTHRPRVCACVRMQRRPFPKLLRGNYRLRSALIASRSDFDRFKRLTHIAASNISPVTMPRTYTRTVITRITIHTAALFSWFLVHTRRATCSKLVSPRLDSTGRNSHLQLRRHARVRVFVVSGQKMGMRVQKLIKKNNPRLKAMILHPRRIDFTSSTPISFGFFFGRCEDVCLLFKINNFLYCHRLINFLITWLSTNFNFFFID